MDFEKKQRNFFGHGLTLARYFERLETLLKLIKYQNKMLITDITAELLKLTLDVQNGVTIDEKQDELIEQLEKSQTAITSGLEDLTLF